MPSLRPTCAWLALAAALTTATTASAAPSLDGCRTIADGAQRLKCYDDAVRGADVPAPTGASASMSAKPAPRAEPAPLDTDHGVTLDNRWDLGPENAGTIFEIRRHKPVYLLPVVYSDGTNDGPFRAAGGVETRSGDPVSLDRTEAKFQLSLKTRAYDNLFGTNGDLWAGYTQSSRWQVYNSDSSRPFRETNYEPELILSFETDYDIFGWKGRIANLSLNHQSNGRADPISRSWNRLIGEVAFERNDTTLAFRPWYRIPESRSDDDNPDIENYIGRGEMLLSTRWKNHIITFTGRHSLRGGDASRGSASIDWAFPLTGQLYGYAQLFHGYGESMIDYNFKATRLGLGVSLVRWR